MHDPLIGLVALLLLNGSRQVRRPASGADGLRLFPRPMPVAE